MNHPAVVVGAVGGACVPCLISVGMSPPVATVAGAILSIVGHFLFSKLTSAIERWRARRNPPPES